MNSFQPTKYLLESVATARCFDDTGWLLDDPQGRPEQASLIRARYEQTQLRVGEASRGIYRFADWLPVRRILDGSSSPVTFRSRALGAELGLKNLYITLSGYYPAVGACMTTCSFKETEAYSVCARMSADCDKILVVASAGNTARAFARVCSDNNIPLLLCVPQDNLDALWFAAPLNPCVRLISPRSGADYFDAIHLGNLAVQSPRFFAEGGAKNIARRDGMGTTMLSAAIEIGRIPDYYFQAVGSGTGAIAAWEANGRLRADGRFGDTTCKLVVSQNAPFTPMYDAWQADSRALLPYDDAQARADVDQITAKVLSNRRPPYSIIGGLYDALKATDGDITCHTNAELREAGAMFERCEGVDIHPAAAAAVASLRTKVARGQVPAESCVMLNITGAGEKLFKAQTSQLYHLAPSHVFDLDASADEVRSVIESLF